MSWKVNAHLLVVLQDSKPTQSPIIARFIDSELKFAIERGKFLSFFFLSFGFVDFKKIFKILETSNILWNFNIDCTKHSDRVAHFKKKKIVYFNLVLRKMLVAK